MHPPEPQRKRFGAHVEGLGAAVWGVAPPTGTGRQARVQTKAPSSCGAAGAGSDLSTGSRRTSLRSRSRRRTSTTSGCSDRFCTRTGSSGSSREHRWGRLKQTEQRQDPPAGVGGAGAGGVSYHSWPRRSNRRSRPCRRTSTPGSRTRRWRTGRCRRRTLSRTLRARLRRDTRARQRKKTRRTLTFQGQTRQGGAHRSRRRRRPRPIRPRSV